MVLTALKRISNTIMTGLSVDIFVEAPGLPPSEFPRASSKVWRVPPLKYITNSPIFGGPLGPQTKFHKGPWIFRGPWPLSPGPREPYMTIKRYCSVPQTLILIVIFKMLVSYLSVYKRYIYIYEVYVVFIHVTINYEKSFHKFNWIKMTSCRFWWKKKLMPMQIYIIHTEIHQWEYTWRLTKCDLQQPDFEPHAVEINSRKSHTT